MQVDLPLVTSIGLCSGKWPSMESNLRFCFQLQLQEWNIVLAKDTLPSFQVKCTVEKSGLCSSLPLCGSLATP